MSARPSSARLLRLRAGATSAWLLAATMLVLLIVGVTQRGQPTANRDGDLQESVVAMYTAIADGDYVRAYEYRSDRCKAVLTSAEFAAAMNEIYGNRNLAAGWPSYSARADSDSATVVFKYNDIDAEPDAESGRTWARTPQGWRFDNCR